MGHHRPTHPGQVLGDHWCRHQPLVPQQPHVSGGHSRFDVLRVCGGKRRGTGPLRGSGKAGTHGKLVSFGLCPRLVPGYPLAKRSLLALRAFRPVALRAAVCPVPCPAGRGSPPHPRSHHGPASQGGALGLAPLLPAVQPQPAGIGGPGAASRSAKRRANRGVGGRAAAARQACLCRGGPRRRGKLAASVVYLAGQRPHVFGQRPRVLPEALLGNPQQRHCAGVGGGSPGRGAVAAGGGGEAGFGGGSELPHGYFGPLRRCGAASSHLVRKSRPQLHRLAFLYPSAFGSGAALLGI
ncbi:hypothetical protein HRbin09_01523 [bacterium HR09]|nr:hypothetical protein HRbin09_01523 [bacterium HR09]